MSTNTAAAAAAATAATTHITLTGEDAISYAELTSATLHCYRSPSGPARARLTLDEARAIAAGDPGLVWCRVPVPAARRVGTRIEAGKRGTQDHDRGRIIGVAVQRGGLLYLVAWESGVETWDDLVSCPWSPVRRIN